MHAQGRERSTAKVAAAEFDMYLHQKRKRMEEQAKANVMEKSSLLSHHQLWFCRDCRDGNGPFEECVVYVLPDGRSIGKGACSNCYCGGKLHRSTFRQG